MNNLKAFLLTLPGNVGQRLLKRASRGGSGVSIAHSGRGSHTQLPVVKSLPPKTQGTGILSDAVRLGIEKLKKQLETASSSGLPEPPFGRWQILTTPIEQTISPNTFFVEFANPKYAQFNYSEAGNQTLLKELDTLVSQKRTIIFKFPDKVTINSNILSTFTVVHSLLKRRGGKLMICTSEQQTFLMLLNQDAGFNLHWDLDDALRELKDENTFSAMSTGKTFFPGGYVYNSSKTP